MSNPFNLFRRNQRLMMALLTILAMVSFVFFGPWSGSLGSSNRDLSADTVVETRFGKISQGTLSSMVATREAVKMFVSRVTQARLENEWSRQLKVHSQDVNYIRAIINMKMQQEGGAHIAQAVNALVMPYSASPEEDAVISQIFAKRAEEMKFVVGKDAVKNYIRRDIARGQVSDAEIHQIISMLKNQIHGVNENVVLDGVRTELMAREVQMAFLRGVWDTRTIPPALRLDYFSRREQKATADVSVIRVAEFTSEVAEPTEHEAKSFYEKYKGVYPDQTLSTPGFRVPRKCRFEWFVIPLTPYLAEAKKKVTEVEIAAYYEKHKDNYVRTDDENDKPAAESKEADAKNDSASADKAAEPKADTAKPEPPKAAVPQPSAPENNSSSQRDPARKRMIRLVADEKPAPADAASVEPAQATDPAAENNAPAAKKEMLRPTERPKSYRPLSEVHDEILLEIARTKAVDAQRLVEKGVRDKMLDYFDAYNRWESEASKDKQSQQPQPPEIADFAKEFGVETHGTGKPRTQTEIQASSLGRAFVEGAEGYPNRPFVQAAFASSAVLYRPYKAYMMDKDDPEPVMVLYWKNEQEEEFIPQFDAVKSDVVDALKMVSARDLALKKANALAELAAKSDKPLDEALKDVSPYRVEHIGPVSWLAGSDLPRDASAPLSFSAIEQVPLAGYEFMSKLFSLSPGQAGAAFNNPMTIVYVIKQISLTPSGEELFESFAKKPFNEYFNIGENDAKELLLGWRGEQVRAAKVDWKRAPVMGTRR
jgi:hypothetical protein